MLLNYHIGCFVLQTSCASAGSPDTTLAEPHPNSNTQQSKVSTISDKQH